VGAPDGCGADESRGLPWGVSRRWELPTRESEGSEGKAPKREASLPPPSERRMQGSRMDPNPVWILFGVAKCSFGVVSVLRKKEREEGGGRGRGMEGGGAHCGGKAQLSSEYNPQQTHRTHRKAERRVASHHVCVCGDRGKGKQKKKENTRQVRAEQKRSFGLVFVCGRSMGI